MGTNMMRALLLTSASVAMVATAAPTAAFAQEASYQIDIPAQGMGDALRALGKATKQNIVFNGSLVKGKRSAAVRGRMSASDALAQMLAGSGLKMARGSGGGFVVQAGNVGAAPTSAPQPVRASQGQGRGTITGTVKDETSGAALKGALVELVGTGRTTSTDDLGEFRFASVPAGDQTVRISYLGYVGQQSSFAVGADESYAQDFVLKGGSGDTEIVVYGSRSARAQALNQERTAENISTVVSSDTLGHFDGATISDALRRVPGVSFEQDAVTGDGSNIIVRGLEADFNTVTLNGLRLPEGSGLGRSPSLGNILTDSISKVTINKSLLPNQDSSGTGGLIEIETKGPLDRAPRFASFGVEGARTAKGLTKEFSVNGTVSAIFGADQNFGLSASIQYRKRSIQRFNYSAFVGQFSYLPLDASGNPIVSPFSIDPARVFPFDPGVDQVYPDAVTTGYEGADNRNLAITLAGQWKIGTHTELKFDYVRSQSIRDDYSRTTNFDPQEAYVLLPVDGLGGQVRGVLVTEDALAQSGLPGIFVPPSQDYSFRKGAKSLTDTYSFRGTSAFGALDFNYSLGYASGTTKIPLAGSASFFWRRSQANRVLPVSALTPEALQNLTSDGRVVSVFAPFSGNQFPVPLLTQATFDLLKNPGEWSLSSSGMEINAGRGGENKRYTAKGGAKYSFDSNILKYIEVGGFFESSRFNNFSLSTGSGYQVLPANFSDLIYMPQLGLEFTGTSLDAIGISGGPAVISRSDFEQLFTNIDQVLASNPNLVRTNFSAADPRSQETFTRENNLSLYVMPRLEFGRLELVGGVRFDRVNIRARSFLNPTLRAADGTTDLAFQTRYTSLADGSATQTTFLPRLAATWRTSDEFLIRAGFSASVARPEIQFINGAQRLRFDLRPRFGPNGNQPRLQVEKGNPDIEAARTQNYDISFERYFGDAGQIKLSLFYKKIENLLGFSILDTSGSLDGVTIPDDPRLADLSSFFVQTTQQINGDNPAKAYGLELAVEKQFTFLPGALSGLGFYGNYTYTKGEREIQTVENDQNIRRNIPLTGAPKHSGTAALTYNKYGVDATLAYTMQGRRFDGYANFGFDYYSEADSSLDLRAEYRFKPGFGQWRVWVEASDILKGRKDADVITTQGGANGVPKIYVGGNYYGGRRGTLGISMNF